MKRCWIGILFAAGLAAAAVHAETIVSAGGIGAPNETRGARVGAMGGAGIALADSLHLTLLNPAGWYNAGRTRFMIGTVYSKNVARDAFGQDVADDFGFPALGIAIPFYRTLGLGLQYAAVYDHRFLIFRDRTSDLNTPLDTTHTVAYTERYQGEGGVSRASLTLAFRAGKVSVGMAGDLYFGKTEKLLSLRSDGGFLPTSG
ncbi:MAG TPA: hypothetical protein ENI92_09000, partial [Bacteroidetes bacterium]|nr:hypothetical protein [Bacteroidota bacterium]